MRTAVLTNAGDRFLEQQKLGCGLGFGVALLVDRIGLQSFHLWSVDREATAEHNNGQNSESTCSYGCWKRLSMVLQLWAGILKARRFKVRENAFLSSFSA